jgi:hypothetical protein
MPDEIHLNLVPDKLCLPTEILAIIINELALDTGDNDGTLAALTSCRLCTLLTYNSSPLFIYRVDR